MRAQDGEHMREDLSRDGEGEGMVVETDMEGDMEGVEGGIEVIERDMVATEMAPETLKTIEGAVEEEEEENGGVTEREVAPGIRTASGMLVSDITEL